MSGWVVGERVLVPNEKEGWVSGTLEKCEGIGQDAELSVLGQRFDAKVVERCPEEGGDDDLALMGQLSEGSLLEKLRQRYGRDRIYTSIGGIVIAVNPYREVDGLYGESVMRDATAPHPYALADAAATGLCRDRQSQSLLISGESGAGKTETVKIMLKYLAYRSGGGVDRLLLKTNPILEAFANAKTVRNDNSSRFGKYVRVFLDPLSCRVTAASITSYLLEKTRVIGQLEGERNFHAFYQLVRARKKDPIRFRCLAGTNGGVVDVAGVDDAETWRKRTEPALRHFDAEHTVAPVLEAVMALCELEFDRLEIAGQDDGSRATRGVDACSNALGVESSALVEALTTRQVGSARATNSVDAARRSRDAIAKSLYQRLFDGLVAKLNAGLTSSVAANGDVRRSRRHYDDEDEEKGGGDEEKSGGATKSLYVGLLDIFGFECFQHNSLEQLLINFANERLQNHFNTVVFANEAREYRKEGISIDAVEFVDNSVVVEAIEFGIIAPLEDECALRSGSDMGLLEKIMRGGKDPDKTRLAVKAARGRDCVPASFVVSHFAGDVAYSTSGFVSKNRDALPDGLIALASTSKHPAIAMLFPPSTKALHQQQQQNGNFGARRGRCATTKRLGVARTFGASLKSLAVAIESTQPHFVRCVKPNTKQAAHCFRGRTVLEQLNYMGVLQIVEARRKGYARRYEHGELKKRFYDIIVKPADTSPADVAQQLRVAIDDLSVPCSIAVGRTKTFIKLEAHEKLERMRDDALRDSALAALSKDVESADELEEALRVAVGELRLRGPEIEAARGRLASLRFKEAVDRVVTVLDKATPDFGVDQLARLVDVADEELQPISSSSRRRDDARIVETLKDRTETLRRRIAALDACSRADRDAKRILGKIRNAGEKKSDQHLGHLENSKSNLEACLFELRDERDVLNAAPEALAATATLQLVRDALSAQSDDVPLSKKSPAPSVSGVDGWREDEEDEAYAQQQQLVDSDAALARRLQNEWAAFDKAKRSPRTKSKRKSWLDERERTAAHDFFKASQRALHILQDTAEERENRLGTGVCALKFKGQSAADWKLLRLLVAKTKKLCWQPANTANNSIKRVFSKARSEGTSGIRLDAITRVTIGPEKPGGGSLIDSAHFTAQRSGILVKSRWHYLTISTAERDYVFGGFAADQASDTNSFASSNVVDEAYVELLYWAMSLERLADASRDISRGFGDGCLARAQRVYAAEQIGMLNKRDDTSGRSPLSRLCPALRPLAFVMAQTIEAHPKLRGGGAASFGSRAPDRIAQHASWLPAAILDSPPPDQFTVVVKSSSRGEVGEVLDGQGRRLAAVESAVAYAVANDLVGPMQNSTPLSDVVDDERRRHQGHRRRAAATRSVPDHPAPVHLFAACANLDADLVEALVLRCRLKVDVRYRPAPVSKPSSSWRSVAGDALQSMEPEREMTPLCYVVTWCDVLGEKAVERVVRRLLILRADPELDDGHPTVRFPPTASAVANGSVMIVQTLLHSGASPDTRTSDGRALIHLLCLAASEKHRKALLEALVNAGADVNAAVPSTGDTALHLAAREGLIDVVLGLVEFEANTLQTNSSGLRPAEAALLELQGLDETRFQRADMFFGGEEEGAPLSPDTLRAKTKAIRQCANFLS